MVGVEGGPPAGDANRQDHQKPGCDASNRSLDGFIPMLRYARWKVNHLSTRKGGGQAGADGRWKLQRWLDCSVKVIGGPPDRNNGGGGRGWAQRGGQDDFERGGAARERT